ncbi:hypothetical protein [Halorussus halobius]|uniref:hypothetical protein n=1 Tax=Halorussus halobius TaxID=1710537 RepID=UPI001093141E|nr:hypothetical protein [Halorussus halobius]
MDRRELLASAGVAMGTAAFAGCLGEYRDAADEVGETTAGDSTETERASGTTGESTTAATGAATLTDASLDVVDSDCGQPANEAEVAFRAADLAVDVAGTIAGSDACYVAELEDASYDAEADALALTVVSTRAEGSEACAECVTEIDYEVTATFEGRLPGTVEVVHEAMDATTTVATVESD